MFRVCFFIFLMIFFTTAEAAAQKYINVTIQGVTCPFCINVLTTNLKKLPNVDKVDISSDDQHLVITMKPDKDPDLKQIAQTIEKSGYLSLKTEVSSIKTGKIEENMRVMTAHMNIQNQPCGSCHTSGKK